MEQLCINYANEKLHEQFTATMFKFEQADYEQEGVPWSHVHFEDNIGTDSFLLFLLLCLLFSSLSCLLL